MFKTKQAFTAFKDDTQTDFFTEFRYKPLLAKKLSILLFNKAYTKIETTINLQLRASYTLNLVTDESTNISSYRIINTSVITNNNNCFYISNIKAKLRKLRVEEIIEEAIITVKKIIYRNLLKQVL